MKLLLVDENGAIMQEYGDVTAQADGIDIEAGTLKVVIPGETGSFHVENNVTGVRASKDFDSEDSANWACRSLNLDARPGGLYGVYDERGNRA
jgi:hypothetical protein